MVLDTIFTTQQLQYKAQISRTDAREKKPMTSGHYHKQQFSCKAGSSHSIPFSIPLYKGS